MSTRTLPAAVVVAALAIAGMGGCAARQGNMHYEKHCHLVEKQKGDRAVSHMRMCHTHEHRPDHH